jgi:hypothetical protein
MFVSSFQDQYVPFESARVMTNSQMEGDTSKAGEIYQLMV